MSNRDAQGATDWSADGAPQGRVTSDCSCEASSPDAVPLSWLMAMMGLLLWLRRRPRQARRGARRMASKPNRSRI